MHTLQGSNRKAAVPSVLPAPVDRGLSRELRAMRVVWKRELIRFMRNRGQVAIALVQPVVYLFALGTGVNSLMSSATTHTDYRTYLFPGVLFMSVLVPALTAGISIVWDREFGFLREMLVAPVSRTALLAGKCLGGTTVATCQGVIVLSLAWSAGVPYQPGLMATLFAEMILIALAMTTLGALIAVGVRRVQTFQTALSFALTPMMFLSGAMFPVAGLPHWMTALITVNPLHYAVEPLQRAVADYLPPGAHAQGGASTSWQAPVVLELLIIAALAVGALAVAARKFARPDSR